MRRAIAIAGLLLGTAALDGCGGAREPAAQITPEPADLAGVYAGRLPCSNCSAIAATLWLRPDHRFFLRQQYVDGGPEIPPSKALGAWHWDEHSARVVLAGAGPERRLARLDDARLELETAATAPHVLQRDAGAPAFTDRVLLDGQSTVDDRSGSFTECITGWTLPVAASGGFRELAHRHRVAGARGKSALATIEAHLTTLAGGDAREAWVVDRVVAVKPGGHC